MGTMKMPMSEHGCMNGRVMNTVLGRFEPCPFCKEKRKEEVRTGVVTDSTTGEERNLCELLHLRKSMIGLAYSFEALVPDAKAGYFTKESMRKADEALQDLVSKATIGEAPSDSYLFSLGYRANIGLFAYQYMMRAYKAGLTVAPFVTGADVLRMRTSETYGRLHMKLEYMEKQDDTATFSDLVDRDICVILFDSGCTFAEFQEVAGLMQLRARYDRPTILFTLSSFKQIQMLVQDGEDGYERYALAKHVALEYRKPEYEQQQRDLTDSSAGATMTQEGFLSMFANNSSL